MKFPIHTSRLVLRRFQISDVEPFQAYRSDPLVARYQGWEAPYSRVKAEAFVTEMMNCPMIVSTAWMQIAIERENDHAMIGDCAFHLLPDDLRQAEIGFTLAQPWWGHGYATEAVRALLQFLFTEADLHRVIAVCDVLNKASMRVLERVGMRREGHFVENIFFKGAYGSEYQYAILAREWRENDKSLSGSSGIS